MSIEKDWVTFTATMRKDNRVTFPPPVVKALNLKDRDSLEIKVRKMKPGEVE